MLVALLGIITGTIPVVIFGGVVFVIGVFYDASKNKEALNKKKSNNDIVAELLEREYKKKEDELKRELETKTAALEKLEKSLEDEKKEIGNEVDANKILITKEKFETIYSHLKETCDFIWGICKESEFQNYIEGIKENSTDRTDNSKKLYSSLKFFIIKDILRSYERLGHRYYSSERYGEKFCIIDFDKAEGQVLYSIIAQMMQFDSQSRFEWSEFLQQMKGNDNYNRQLRQTTKEALGVYANADVHASASNGLDDFEFCIILHNYNEKYEKIYRVKMLRIATLIAKADDHGDSLDKCKADSNVSRDRSKNFSSFFAFLAELFELRDSNGKELDYNRTGDVRRYTQCKDRHSREGVTGNSIEEIESRVL